ncbi:hypothetical protein [Glacieibacterium sp.]|uniref:hypothetical protein n=1 Tax=Glacieibacterium sp. TaxID=2860237 RepID=UPI003AFF9C10
MTRAAAIKLILGGILIAISVWLWLRPRDIDEQQAGDLAKAMAVRYAATTGEPVAHFGRARRIVYPDGWEFVWTYRPCPDDASLRVFVPRSGKRPRYTEQPDCESHDGFNVKPVSV